MFDEFVLDSQAHEILLNPGERHWLGPWPELVRALDSEGATMIADVREAAGRDPHQRGAALRQDMRDPSRWFQAMAYYDAVASRAQEFLGDDPNTAKSASWDFDPDALYGITGADGQRHSLAVVLSEGSKSADRAHRDLYSFALHEVTSHLREVNACVVACKTLGVAPFVWAPYRKYFAEKLSIRSEEADPSRAAEAGRQFFKVAFPAYAPTTVKDFSRLRRDSRLRRLRAEILRAATSGETLDPRYPQRILEEVLRAERRTARVRRIIGWIATGIGAIPVPGLGPAATLVAESIGAVVERRARQPWHWFYLVSDGRGGT